MNGLSLIFAVVVILTVAVLSGILVMVFIGTAKMVAHPPWKRHKAKLPPVAHHHG